MFRALNASFIEVHNDSDAMRDINENGLYIVPRQYGSSEVTQLNVYPYEWVPMVIEVPESLPYSEFAAYLQALTTHTVLGYSSITFTVIVAHLSFFRFIKQKKILFFQSLADAVNLLMNDNGDCWYLIAVI